MNRIKIFVDSGSDISEETAMAHNISVIPLTISFGAKIFKDFYEITSNKFFELLEKSDALPKTSQPNSYEFMEKFSEFENDYDDIICFTMSQHGSGTYNSAVSAKKELEEKGFRPNIHIVDSKSISFGETILATKAAQLVKLGEKAADIAEKMRYLSNFIGSYVIPLNLDAIRRGGRVNTVTAFIGSAFNIRPVIQVIDGWGRNISKIRSDKNMITKFTDIFFDKCQNTKEIFISHANSLDRANELAEKFRERAGDIVIHLSEMGAVMGTHVGKGGLGIFFIEKAPIVTK